MKKIYVISDGTGRTAEQILQAALTQFPASDPEIIMRKEVRTELMIEEVVLEALEHKGIIIHTLVSEALREQMLKISRIHNVDAIDLMGPLLSRLSLHLAKSPTEEPGLFFRLNKEYFKRIDSMQFAFTHDDGQRFAEYNLAEIILVGVSRTFKTPLCIYLAFKGWFVANYPIILGVEPPEILRTLPSGRVFGLTTEPFDLSTLRSARQAYLGGTTHEYANIEYVRKELIFAQQYFDKLQCPVIHVTHKPIEEIASEILTIRKRIMPDTTSRRKKDNISSER